MNEVLLQFGGESPFDYQPMFFDEPSPQKRHKKELCKIYNDGSHYMAIPLDKSSSIRRKKHRIRRKSETQETFDSLYAYTVAEGKNETQTKEFLQDNLTHLFNNDDDLNTFISENIKRKANNLHNRKKRFRRKASLHKWSYFITITYDSEKCTELEFRVKMRRCLCNLHTRRNWRYMGVFERAPETGRLHFHALLYVPENAMIGSIIEKQDYSTKQHKMQTTHENDFFLDRFGRNDFAEIKQNMRTECTGYILKYIEKSGERITYSRGIPTEIYSEIDENDVVCKMRDFVLKYVLFDDVINWERDIADYTPSDRINGYIPRYLS